MAFMIRSSIPLSAHIEIKVCRVSCGECPYVSVRKSVLGFTPNVIVVQQEGECLANTQWIRGQSNLYCANYENNAYAGIAVGSAKGFFNPDSIDIQIPVRFPSRKYIVKIYP